MFLEKNNFCNGLRNSINKPENENPNNNIFIAQYFKQKKNVFWLKCYYSQIITHLFLLFYLKFFIQFQSPSSIGAFIKLTSHQQQNK